ncbi:MAG: T9SS type A sorting domain-containing protein [Crocinitomicaceae bacterium]|nr:T9SS type A sorting domain-containing protein [Crocinitomicaceae bacterium]
MKKLLLLALLTISMDTFSQVLWSEDFAAGIPATWSNVTVSGPVDWKYTTVGHTGPYPTDPINSESAANGWLIVDSDGDNFSGGGAEDAQLTTDVIDLTGATTAVLTFNQMMREWQSDVCIVRVTTDGGSNWTDWILNDGIGQAGTSNPDVFGIDITAAIAGNPANVQIMFWWQASWDYGWQIDDIKILGCQPTTGSSLVTADCGYSAPNGSLLTSSGIYQFVLPNAAGCDSLAVIDLTINNPTLDVSVDVNGATISSNLPGVAYQWIDCGNGNTEIVGATNQDYTATANGEFAVIVIDGFCSDTSACSTIDNVGIDAIEQGVVAKMYPIPASAVLNLEFVTFVEEPKLFIFDMSGKLVSKLEGKSGTSIQLNTSKLTKGSYLLRIEHTEGVTQQRFIKD